MLRYKYGGVSQPVTYVSHSLCNWQLFSLDQFNLKMSHAHKLEVFLLVWLCIVMFVYQLISW